MTAQDPTEASRTVALERVDAILAIKPRQLVRRKELGDALNFEAGSSIFSQIHRLYSELKECDFTKLNVDDLNGIVGRADSVLRSYERIRNFSPSNLFREWGNDPVLQRDRLIEEARGTFRQSYEYFKGIIPFARHQATQRELQDLVTEAKETQKQLLREYAKVQSIGAQADQALSAIRQTAGESGVANYSGYFENQAEEHRRVAIKWLWAVAGSIALTIVVSFIDAQSFGKIAEFFHGDLYADAAYAIFSKFVLLGTLYFSVVWTSRMYRASRHNYVISKHRANALRTFDTFVQAAKDDTQTKNAVLLQATQCIYAHQPSGYIINEPDPSPSSAQVLEIIRQGGGHH